MKIFEITGRIKENPQPMQQSQQGQTQQPAQLKPGQQVTIAKPTNGQAPGGMLPNNDQMKVTKVSGNELTLGGDDPNAPQTVVKLDQQNPNQLVQAGDQTILNLGDQPAAENMDDVNTLEQEIVSIQDGYYPTGYNDDNREKAMARKAMQDITSDSRLGETNDIVALARRVAQIKTQSNSNQQQDVLNLKKLAGI
jgi:hypothetical protein